MTPHDHLSDEARAVLDAPLEERIRFIQADRFIPNAEASNVLDALEELVTRPPSVRPPCIALVAEGGTGKSTLLSVFRRKPQRDKPEASSPVAYCVLDAFPEPRAMQIALLTALGIPVPSAGARWGLLANDLVKRTVATLGIRVVILDEIQHLMNLPPRVRHGMWDWIKWLSTACRVSVVCSGPPGSERPILEERQLRTRFRVMHLNTWRAGPLLADFLRVYETSLPLMRSSGLATPAMQEEILKQAHELQQTSGVTHGIKLILEAAAVRAIVTEEERITVRLLQAWKGQHGSHD